MPESIRSLVSRTMAGYKLGGYAEATISSELMERERALADSAINLAEARWSEGTMFREIFDQVGIRYTEPDRKHAVTVAESLAESVETQEHDTFVGPAARIATVLMEHGVAVTMASLDSDGELTITGMLAPESDSNEVQPVKSKNPTFSELLERLDNVGRRVSAIEGRLDNPTLSL
jgi:hypothetical protein